MTVRTRGLTFQAAVERRHPAALVTAAGRILVPIAVVLLAVNLLSPRWVHALFIAMTWAALTASLQIYVHPTRRLLLCQSLFFGGGAYLYAILSLHTGMPTLLAAAVATLIVGAGAALLAAAINRTDGHVFAIATIMVSLIFSNVLAAMDKWTGGASGLVQIQPVSVGTQTLDQYGGAALVLAAITVFAVALLRRITTRPFGRQVSAARQNPLLTASWGLNVGMHHTMLLGVAGILSALCGVVYASTTSAIAPDSFTLWASFQTVTFIIVAGIQRRVLAPIAALLINLLFDGFQFAGSWTLATYGGLLLVAVLLSALPSRRSVRGGLLQNGPTGSGKTEIG